MGEREGERSGRGRERIWMFPPGSGLTFYFFSFSEWAFLSANTFKFHEVQFIFLFFDYGFCLLPKNSLLTAGLWKYLIILSLRGFRILAFTFGLIIHPKFILKYDVK